MSDNFSDVSLLSTHDSWVKITEHFNNGMWQYFRDGWIPARDPFPMGGWSEKKQQLWALDLKRMTIEQINGMLYIMAVQTGEPTAQVMSGKSRIKALIDAAARGGIFLVNHRIIESVRCGKEGVERLGELLDFINLYPDQYPPMEDWEEFVAGHYKTWISDRKKPKEIRDIEDVHPCIVANSVPQFKTTQGRISPDEIIFEISNFQWS